jgi:phage baseplate assembly protein W
MVADLRCFDDLDEFGAETTNELENLAQDLYHRLIEPRGSNLDDPDRGLGVEEMLSGEVDPGLKQRIEAELRKDERVTLVSATISEIEEGSFRIDIQIEADEDELGLVLEYDAAGVLKRVA